MKRAVSSKLRARAFFRERHTHATKVLQGTNAADTSGAADGKARPRWFSVGGKRRGYLRQYLAWVWPRRRGIAGILAISLLVAALDLAWPMAIKIIIDDVLGARDVSRSEKLWRLNIAGLAIVGLLLVKQPLDSLRAYRTIRINTDIVWRLRRRLYRRMLKLPLSTLGEFKSGGVVSRLGADVDMVSTLLQQAVLVPGVAVVRMVLTVTVLLTLSWRLAVAALLLLPPLTLLSLLWVRKVRPVYRSAAEDRGNVDAGVAETFGGIRVVRAFRREKREERGYAVGQHTAIRKRLYAERIELALEGGWGILVPLSSLTIIWAGGRLVLAEPPLAEVGDLFVFQIYAVLLLQPVFQIVQGLSQTQKGLTAMERVFDVLEMPEDKPDEPGAIEAPARVEEFRLERLSFAYPKTPAGHSGGAPAETAAPMPVVLKDVNLVVRGGMTVALVGPSGAGKSTLTDLVARFQDPTVGRITLNGVDLRRLRLSSYRRLLAVAQQDVFLFDGTVAENIAYGRGGRRGVGREAIEEAARQANAHEFIERLPEGYDTLVGERGFKLSGGQKQRLSIARAVLAGAQILILDEATSNLDSESEQLIRESLTGLFAGRTTFVIAHRLSTITHADLIVALDGGRVVETGTHEDLMSRGGFYAAMVERQRGAFGEG